MRYPIYITLLLSVLLFSCKSIEYVPVETIKTEYQDRWQRDSIYLHDSVMVRIKGDTVWMEKYKTIYKEKLVKDSIFIVDSIQVPYPVVEYKEVNKLTKPQSLFIWFGKVLIGLIGIGLIIIFLRWKRLF